MAAELALGTRNAGKRRELLELLGGVGVALLTLDEAEARLGRPIPEVVEDADDFVGNAAKKAVETARAVGGWALGEDSGLCVDALGGQPGVYSARYAGQPTNDAANNAKLLAALDGVPDAERGAGYVCVGVLARIGAGGEPQLAVFRGECRGRIAAYPRGDGGFGYDPLFVPEGEELTFGELPPEFKRRVSHRARMAALLAPKLAELAAAGESAPPAG